MKYLFFFLFISHISCVNKKSSNFSPNFSLLNPECFYPNTLDPIIGPGNDFFTIDYGNNKREATWGDPHVLKINDQFVMYASSLPNNRLNDTIEHIAIYRLTSLDGYVWSLNPTHPVFDRTGSSTWNADGVETPSVVFFQNEFHLFYTSYTSDYSDSSTYRIGHAKSSDGINWTRVSTTTPLLAPSDPNNSTPDLSFNQWIVAEPGAVVFNNKIYLYYAATGSNTEANSTAEVIGLIIYDGSSWSAQKEVMRPNQAVYPRQTSPYYKGFSTPAATVINNQVHLFTTVVIQNDSPTVSYKHTKIHHAYSTNGIDNWVQDSTSIADYLDLTWHNNDIISPTALLDGNTIYLWYGGNQGTLSTVGIGLMTCEL